MSCIHCKGVLPEYGIVVLNGDGDCACSEKCAEAYKKERDHFLNNILPNDKAFATWLGVPVEMVKSISQGR